jgi:type IV pilus assembly protein PilB
LIGELLVAEGAITREQLSGALRIQKASNMPLGRLLVEKGMIDEDRLAQVLGKQLDMPYMIPHSGQVDMQVFCRLPREFLKSNSVLPIGETDGVITVVIPDPTDSDLIGRLEKVLQARVNAVTCGKTKIDAVIDELMFRRDMMAGTESEGELLGGVSTQAELSINSHRLAGIRTDRGTENTFNWIICDALRKGASDIHFEPLRDHMRVRYRIDGVMTHATNLPLSILGPFTRRAKALTGLDTTEERRPQQGRLCIEVDGELVDFLVAVCPSVFGESMAFHCASMDIEKIHIENLGMLPRELAAYTAAIERNVGAALVVGPSGAGKTTTFYATLRYLNDGSRKIITVETPVELALGGVVQNSLRGFNPPDVIEALEGAMQHDPDVIGLGQIVSDPVAEKLLHVAMTGHNVFSTMHAEDSASALLRLSNLSGAASFLISCSILVVAQVLVRKVCPECSEVYVPSPVLVREFQVKDLDLDAFDFRRGTGCSECLGTGFRGRTGIFEVFEAGPDMQTILLGNPSVNDIRSAMISTPHFLSMRQSGFIKAVQGQTTLEEVTRVVPAMREGTVLGKQHSLENLYTRAGLTLEQTGETKP